MPGIFHSSSSFVPCKTSLTTQSKSRLSTGGRIHFSAKSSISTRTRPSSSFTTYRSNDSCVPELDSMEDRDNLCGVDETWQYEATLEERVRWGGVTGFGAIWHSFQ